MRTLSRALAALSILSLALAGCGRYGPPRRAVPAGQETGIDIQKKGGTAPETRAPSEDEEPEDEEKEPESR
jgi:predicted small lipoprotein YifL